MKQILLSALGAVPLLIAAGSFAAAPEGRMERISTHMGEMSVVMPGAGDAAQVRDRLRYEPYQMTEELLSRDDLVFVMRHGPTDWSVRDARDVAPSDCANQRQLSAEGRQDMVNLGILLAANQVRPGRIVASEWCRNQQTLDAMLEGMRLVAPDYVDALPVETSADLNLLLSLQGAPNVTPLRERVASWTGTEADGPLLLLTHYTNIEEMTEFRVYEGEILVLDPARGNRVRGYLRLNSAAPDVGHFGGE